MRFWVFIAALVLALPLSAQETPVKKKPAAKKPAAAKKTSHRKPTPEQIRKFNELEKKQKQ
jgi:hypothetical protein